METIICSKDFIPTEQDIVNKNVYVKTDDYEKPRLVVRNQQQLDELVDKLYYKKCIEFNKLSQYALGNDYLEDIAYNVYERGTDRILDRLGVFHTQDNLHLLFEYLLFDRCSKKFEYPIS